MAWMPSNVRHRRQVAGPPPEAEPITTLEPWREADIDERPAPNHETEEYLHTLWMALGLAD